MKNFFSFILSYKTKNNPIQNIKKKINLNIYKHKNKIKNKISYLFLNKNLTLYFIYKKHFTILYKIFIKLTLYF